MDELVPFTMEEWKESMKRRIRRRQARVNTLSERFIEQIDLGKVDGTFEFERERIWLDGFALEGHEGLNLCCGHFAIGDSYGMDINRTIGSDFVVSIERVDRFGEKSMDYVISNHFESVETPMRAFHSIFKILKPGGVFALVFLDADAPDNSDDADDVMNSFKKVTFFSRAIMRRYLIKAGFTDIKIGFSESTRFLRMTARRPVELDLD